MAVAFIQEFKIVDGDTTTSGYDAVASKLGINSADEVPGLLAHTAGFDQDAGVFRIFDVWEDADSAARFQEERLGPIIQEMMANNPSATPPQREGTYELHDLIA